MNSHTHGTQAVVAGYTTGNLTTPFFFENPRSC